MKTHNLDLRVHSASLQVTVSDPKHHIDSGDKVIWHVSEVPTLSGDTLDMNLLGAVLSTTLSGSPKLESTISKPGSHAGDEMPYALFLYVAGVRTPLTYLDGVSPLVPTPTGPCLVLDTNGPPPGGSGCGHHPHGPKYPSGRDGETPDHP